ncbi:hypothetical protein, partial [Acinetobacter soli]|uniref:hypothetical protein n=1 Tax=Acinetobacter soli TaxID=487316 RepID=UPI00209005F9
RVSSSLAHTFLRRRKFLFSFGKVIKMQIVKNIFISFVYMMIVSILIVIFYRIGIHKYVNITVSAIMFGLLTFFYFKTIVSSLLCHLFYYGMLFSLSQTLDVLMMLLISISTMVVMKIYLVGWSKFDSYIKENQIYRN